MQSPMAEVEVKVTVGERFPELELRDHNGNLRPERDEACPVPGQAPSPLIRLLVSVADHSRALGRVSRGRTMLLRWKAIEIGSEGHAGLVPRGPR